MRTRTTQLSLVLGLGLFVVGVAAARASDPAGNSPETESQDASADLEARYALPAGGVPELLTFIENIKKDKRPPSKLNKPVTRLRYHAVRNATEKIARIATAEDKKLPGYNDAIGMHFRFRTTPAMRSSVVGEKLRDDLIAHYAETAHPSDHALMASRQIGSLLEYDGRVQESISYCQQFGTALVEHDDERAAKAGRRLLGAARRLSLIGQPPQITGTRLDGTPFDWKTLRGKVVLVDFWATWCGPCTKELPRIKSHYERYADKGFEVVAISVDEDRQSLDAYLAKESIPWITLYDGDFENSLLAIHYGLSGIPTTWLVDREGKVVSLNARGDELDRKLAELFDLSEN